MDPKHKLWVTLVGRLFNESGESWMKNMKELWSIFPKKMQKIYKHKSWTEHESALKEMQAIKPGAERADVQLDMKGASDELDA